MAARLAVSRVCNPFTGLPELHVTRERDLDPDPCVVEAAPLAAALDVFVGRWRKTRPCIKGQRGSETSIDPIGPYASLAADTGLPEAEIRRVESRRYVELRTADALIAAGVGDVGMFYMPPEQGGLRIVPNRRHPAYDKDNPADCGCGGSVQ